MVGVLVVFQDRRVCRACGGEAGHCGGGGGGGSSGSCRQHLWRHGYSRATVVVRLDVQGEVDDKVWVGEQRVRRDVVRAEGLGVVQLVAAVPEVDASRGEMSGGEHCWRQGDDGGDLQVLDSGVVWDRQGEGVFVASFDGELHSVREGAKMDGSVLIRAGGVIRIRAGVVWGRKEGKDRRKNRKKDRKEQKKWRDKTNVQ